MKTRIKILFSISIILVLTLTTISIFNNYDIADAESENQETTQSNTISQSSEYKTDAQQVTLITKNGATQVFDVSKTIPYVPFSYKNNRLANDKISIRPLYRSVDENGNITYTEGNSCVSM